MDLLDRDVVHLSGQLDWCSGRCDVMTDLADEDEQQWGVALDFVVLTAVRIGRVHQGLPAGTIRCQLSGDADRIRSASQLLSSSSCMSYASDERTS